MNKFLLSSLLSFLSLSSLVSSVLSIETVTDLNIPQYMGRWYQMYADKFVLSTFERNAVCMTADYYVQDDGNINVFNAQNHGDETGELETITGYATLPDSSQPGKLKVFFDSAGPPGGAPYWIVKLGPLDSNNQYSYSIVTDNTQTSLFVLARDVAQFNSDYDAEVKEFLQNNGFTGFRNSPIPTTQNDQCAYRPVPSLTTFSADTNKNDMEEIPIFSKQIKDYVTYATNQIQSINVDKLMKESKSKFSKFKWIFFPGTTPPTVSEVDIDSYIGRWYQIYANKLVYLTFERNAVCQTADYKKLEDGNGISVVNAQNEGSPTGDISSISGTAVITDPSQPGKLKLKFTTVPFPGDYWIVKLGPIVDGQYQYSIVSDPDMSQLFVIARDVDDFKANYDEEVLTFLEENGFTGKAAPIASVQGEDCNYSDPSTSYYIEGHNVERVFLRGGPTNPENPTAIKY